MQAVTQPHLSFQILALSALTLNTTADDISEIGYYQGVMMGWIEQTEQKKTLLVSGTIIICMVTLIVTARRNAYSYDVFWHLQAGLDWLENGLSPWLDHFSFTFNGKEIANPPYIFQALLGLLVKWFGFEPGIQIYRFSSFILLFGLFVAFLRKQRAPAVVYCLVLPLVVVLLQFRAFTRPELLSFSFSVLAMLLYYRTRNGMTTAGMLSIVGLMFLWNNYHTAIIGYVIFFGYFIDIALKQIHEGAPTRDWLLWLGWGLAIIAVGYLTPSLNFPLIKMLNFSPKWAELITEYNSLALYLDRPVFYGLVAISLITLALLVLKRQFGLLVVCTILTCSSALMPRLIVPSGIIILFTFTWMICEFNLEDWLRRLTTFSRNVIGGMILALFVLSIGSGVYQAREFMEENKLTQIRYPEDVANYMIDHKISGRIFNEYGMGGYLIFRLSPDSQVYIDGRTNILYPIGHAERYLDAIKSPEVLRAEIKKYDINLAIFPHYLEPFSFVQDSGILGLDYVGATYSLFRKNEPNFPVLGKLLAQPSCWSEELSAELEEEQTRAKMILPEYSMLLPFSQFVVGYTGAEDKAAYLTAVEEKNQWNVPKLRFAAYQALNLGLYQMSLKRFAGLAKLEFRDFLARAMAFINLGEWNKAEKTLDAATRHNWPTMKFDDLVILHGLLEQLRESASLKLFDDGYVDRLAEQVGSSDDSTPPSIPDIHSFCSRL